MTMPLTLRYKINGAILVTFIVISLIFISIQLLVQSRRSEAVSKEIEILLQMVVEREREAIANEIYQNLERALTLRLDHIREKGNIFLLSLFDKTGQLLVSRGLDPDRVGLSKDEIQALSNDILIRHENYGNIYSMVYMQKIEIIGEPVGFIRICYSLEALKQEQLESMMILGALLGSILVIMLVLLNLIMSRTVVKPILSLSESMNRMRAGKFEPHVSPKSGDEIETLSTAFNRMGRDLATSYQEVDRKRFQLSSARQYLSSIINSMPSILVGVDEALQVTQWNLRAERFTGIEPEEAIGKPLSDVFPRMAQNEQMVHRALQKGSIQKGETVQWEIDDSPCYMDITVYPLVTSGAVGTVIRIDDVTDRRLTEAALHESQEKYRLVVENANDSIIILQDGLIKFANQKSAALTGYTVEKLMATPFIDFVFKEDQAVVMKNHVARMQGRPAPASYDFKIKNKSGGPVWVNISAVLISWDNRPAILAFLRDISEQKRLEEQILHVQKMEAIGTLAGGIAHDFNNLLQVIQGYAQLLLLGKKGPNEYQKEVKSILTAAQKGGDLTMQLLTFGRKVETNPKSVSINMQIEKTLKMLSRTIPKMIDIQFRPLKDLPNVFVDPGQIEQVVLNLVINARDAMPDGGRIDIETQMVSLDDSAVKIHMVPKPGKYVLMRIADTGHGMSSDVVDHIFEPFYTTKKIGDGTGLGLAIVYGIVKNHSGSIQCKSMPGRGTTFDVYFPATAPPAIPTPKPVAALPDPVGGTETILLVDDEENIRDIGQQLLEKFGYTVLTAANTEEALEIYTESQTPIHLVLLDLVMPGMGGSKCLNVLLEMDPEAKIVIASGYHTDPTKKSDMENALPKARGFIKKPFVLESMLHEVRRVLDGHDT
jgi:PAS domain S-box-containing protein